MTAGCYFGYLIGNRTLRIVTEHSFIVVVQHISLGGIAIHREQEVMSKTIAAVVDATFVLHLCRKVGRGGHAAAVLKVLVLQIDIEVRAVGVLVGSLTDAAHGEVFAISVGLHVALIRDGIEHSPSTFVAEVDVDGHYIADGELALTHRVLPVEEHLLAIGKLIGRAHLGVVLLADDFHQIVIDACRHHAVEVGQGSTLCILQMSAHAHVLTSLQLYVACVFQEHTVDAVQHHAVGGCSKHEGWVAQEGIVEFVLRMECFQSVVYEVVLGQSQSIAHTIASSAGVRAQEIVHYPLVD